VRSHRAYNKLTSNFNDLKQVCAQLVESNKTQARLFPVYYRVGFYGDKWGDLNRREYIYKESAMVRLADFTQRLKDQYGRKYGEDKVQVLSNSTTDFSKLDPEIYYFQLVSVVPYLEQHEIDERPTEWDRNYDICTHGCSAARNLE